MTTMLQILTWTLLLAIAQIVLVAALRGREVGVAYGMGPRDDPGVPFGRMTGRLKRAKDNLYETLPIFAIAVLIAHAAGRETTLAVAGAWTICWAGWPTCQPMRTGCLTFGHSSS